MMRIFQWHQRTISCVFFVVLTVLLQACAGGSGQYDNTALNVPLFHGQAPYSNTYNEKKYVAKLPVEYDTGGQRLILVDPSVHAWGAYDENGNLVRGGIATAGADYCQDEGRPCRTHAGMFHLYRMGDETCASKTYPIGEGGALMPYCMFFNGGQSLHGSPDQLMAPINISHGCVHLRLPDAAWLRYQFADLGTKVIILPYD